MRYILCLLVFFYVNLLFQQNVQATEAIYISANQAVLMECQSGRVIFEKNSHERRPIASITKVMTALLAIEYGSLDEEVTVSKRATLTGGSSIYLHEGEKIKLEDLLYGLMLRSGNDAAVAIAEHIAGSVEGFSFLMNQKALYLGMSNTSFKNPHGLDEENHYSSAYDIALLMRHAMENEQFKKISETKVFKSENRDYRWFNKNKLLTHLYPHSTGGKTGFTKKAGRTLVSSAEKENMALIAVTLNAPDDWNDHIQLYEMFFNKINNKIVEKKGKKKYAISDDDFITGTIKESIIYPLSDDEIHNLRKKVILKRTIDNDVIGEVIYELQNEEVFSVPIYEYVGHYQLLINDTKRIIRQMVRLE